MMRYARALDDAAVRVVMPGGPFEFLLDIKTVVPDDPYALDIQLREGNKLMYYHGTTRLLTVEVIPVSGKTPRVRATADKAYKEAESCRSEYGALMKTWVVAEAPLLCSTFCAYLARAVGAAGRRYYRNQKEGYWQNRLCINFGPRWRPEREWLIIDRECVVGFDSKKEKDAFYENARHDFQSVRDNLQKLDDAKWGKATGKAFGDELDFLAIDRAGQLVVIELKHGANSSGIYWGPLQAGFYGEAFLKAHAAIVPGIRELVRQKIRLGLLPPDAQALLDHGDLAPGGCILAVADPKERSKCWGMMSEVLEEMVGNTAATCSLKIAKINERSGSIDVRLTGA